MQGIDPFKKCCICGTRWATREEFLRDDAVLLIGYQANFVDLKKGLFLFNHSCQGTLSVNVEAFTDLYDGPIFTKQMTGQADCPAFCLHSNEFRTCPQECECAYVRDIMQRLSKSESKFFKAV